MAGPYERFAITIGPNSFQVLTLIMLGSYLLVLLCAQALPLRLLVGAIVLAHLILLLGPPLISQDVFGYLAFARMGALHGLNPYTQVPLEAPTDPILPFIGWPTLHSPYGPLFTLGSYPLGAASVPVGLWGFKALAFASSLGAVALLGRAASAMGRPLGYTIAFMGLNPVLLELAVGGAHNDTLLLALVAAALALSAGTNPRLRTGASLIATAVGIKISAGLALPFLLLAPRSLGERIRVGAAAVGTLMIIVLAGSLEFGGGVLGFFGAVNEEQQMVALHSIPAETARMVGLSGTPTWWRYLFAAVFLLVLAYGLWRTAHGADWRSAAGWTTIALLLCSAWLLPWYAVWVLPFAALSEDRRLRLATIVLCGYVLLIHLQLATTLLSPS